MKASPPSPKISKMVASNKILKSVDQSENSITNNGGTPTSQTTVLAVPPKSSSEKQHQIMKKLVSRY
jgi:hypothetical protein